MVYFYCNVCGESLKKNQVEKHYQQKCRNCSVLSCVDCGQEFHGTEYELHTKCISEEEKYSGKNYKPKPNANKGEQKQEQWINQVQEAISKVSANPELKSLLKQLKNYPNIPRKQAKFENFLANSLRVRNSNLAHQAWQALSTEMTKSVVAADGQDKSSASEPVMDGDEKVHVTPETGKIQNGEAMNDEMQNGEIDDNYNSHKKKRKRQRTEEDEKPKEDEQEMNKKRKKKKQKEHTEEKIDEVCSNIPVISSESGADHDNGITELTFKWENAIIGALKRAPEKQLPIKKLRKKVLGEFNARRGDGKVYSEEKLLSKFMRKVSKNKRLKIKKDNVRLVD